MRSQTASRFITFPFIFGLVLVLLGGAHMLIGAVTRDESVLQLASNVFNPLVSLLGGLIILLAARALAKARETRRALAWAIMGAAMLFTSAGDTAWTVIEMLLLEAPTPSIADVFYILFYLLFLLGSNFLQGHTDSWREWWKGTIDILIVMLTAFLGLWIYFLGPAFEANQGQPVLNLFVLIVYPFGDIILLWAQLIVLFSSARYPLRRSLWLLVMGLSIFIVSDFGYSLLSLQDMYQTGMWTDVGYSLGYMLMGLAGCLEYNAASRRRATSLPASGQIPLWVQLLPYAWMVLAYWILVSTMYIQTALSKAHAAMFVGMITLFVVLRQVIALQENHAMSLHLGQLLLRVKQQANDLELANREMHIEILERRRMAERLSYDAMHDGLTGLPNRALFLDRLAQAAHKQHRQPSMIYSVMFLDLDGFKVVNDSLGHLLGDRLLIRVAGLLRSCVRASDTVARLGGDEFVILIEDLSDSRGVVDMANRVMTELSRPIDLEGTLVYITTSIGIVLNVKGYERPEDLLRDADLAMYHAKSLGKARYSIFEPAMRAVAVTRLALENELRQALERGEFFLEYQPVFNLVLRRPVGFEALLRWRHPERGRLEPGAFVPVAEEAGLMLPVGRWCLQEACRQAHNWQAHFGALKMTVNISGRQFSDPGFVSMVREILAESDLPGDSLRLEVPENICLENLDSLRSAMGDLRALGVEIQIDDFGTGYSSLSYLPRLPVHAVKIAPSFIEPIYPNGDPRAPEMVRAILAMMQTLGVETWVEGIETDLQLNTLVQMGCHYGQGFYLAIPMPPAYLESWMVQHPMLAQR